MELEFKCMSADERQRYFEQLCEMDEREFRELWENSEVRAKLKDLAKRLEPAQKLDAAASNLIDRKVLLEHKTLIPGFVGEFVHVRDILNAPTVEVAQVVQCEECTNNECCSIREAMGENGYCSKGKRKKG